MDEKRGINTMGLITMVIFLATLVALAGWAYLGVTQYSPMNIIIPAGLGAGTGLILLAEVLDNPADAIMAVIIVAMGIAMAVAMLHLIILM